MIDLEDIMSISKSELQEASKTLERGYCETGRVAALEDDKIRYQAFLILQNRSQFFDNVYPFGDIFRDKLKSTNSYQRSIGLMLIAENTKWDTKKRLENIIDEYLTFLNDPNLSQYASVFNRLGKLLWGNRDGMIK